MDASSPLTADASVTAAPGWDRAMFEWQIAMLGELAEDGLEIVHAIRDQAVAAAKHPEPSRIDFGLAYTRVSKSMRMTLSLQRRYILDLRFEFRHGQPAPAWDSPAPKTPAASVDRIGHGLATGGLSEAKAVDQLEQSLDLYERLDDLIEDLDDEIPDGPFNEILAKLCKDMGLAPDWLERTQARLLERPPLQTAVCGGGEPSAERSEEPMVVGAGYRRRHLTQRSWRNTS
jgi:hypothetical protein